MENHMEFLNLTDITMEASILIILIGVVRSLFRKKMNPNIRYFLWIFVAIRVLIPLQLGFSFVLPESWNYSFPSSFVEQTNDAANKEEADFSYSLNSKNDVTFHVFSEEIPVTEPSGTNHRLEGGIQGKGIQIVFVWLCGVIFLGTYILVSNVRFYIMLKANRRKVRMLTNKIPLYALRDYNCLSGILFPVIYVDIDGLSDTGVIKDVIQHELQHYRVRDNYWQFVRVLCLVLQWHNPFMWWAYSVSKKDCETACDARVVKNLSKKERYQYGSSLITVLERAVKKRESVGFHTSMSGNKKFISERINEIMKEKPKKSIILSILITVAIGGVCLITFRAGEKEEQAEHLAENTYNNIQTEEEQTLDNVQNIKNKEEIEVDIDINDYYITNTGDPSNLYYVDENRVLWGCGSNNYGQLGQGKQDYDFHEEMVPIAEDVIHVDFSQTGFTIYLTADHKLYGMGNAGCGALQQYEEFDAWQYTNGEHYTVTTPILLMEDVVYARCGRSDVACLLRDGSVWIWGAIGFIYDGWNYIERHYEQKPVKVLENAVMVTGGLFNHAALLRDGSVWTWGYNYSGNCGIADKEIVSRPQKVAEDVVMVWTASMNDNIDCQDITEFGGMYKRFWENTIIQKKDGSYWICGANVGDEEKVLKYYYEVSDYPLVCTYEFLPCGERSDEMGKESGTVGE